MAKGPDHPDVFENLTTVWILACNDDNSILTYDGVAQRLGNVSADDVRTLVAERPELFRARGAEVVVEQWKDDMREGKHLPARVEPEDLHAFVDGLKHEDVFRCQFRTAYESEKAELKLIEWGLNHIDRLRRTAFEHKQATAKSWQVWLVFAVSIVNIVMTVVLAALTGGE